MAPIIITGVPSHIVDPAARDPPPRLEINDFIKNERFFSLYIQALNMMHNAPETDEFSSFKIGGIHGKPYVSWNDAPAPTKNSGYCSHRDSSFPTWHRVYAAVFEQGVHAKAKEIAADYTIDKALWIEAAEDLRQPYWDWTKESSLPSQVISDINVVITLKSGIKDEVQNPFLAYTFKPAVPNFAFPRNLWPTTLRRPTTRDANAKSNPKELRDFFRAIQPQLAEDVDKLPTIEEWEDLSNRTVISGRQTTANSLEAIHDMVHYYISGHMGFQESAGFDPIFYLHHAQVDRLLALWERDHPQAWTNDKKALSPFWNTTSTYWPSASVASTKTFNYTYADIAPKKAEGFPVSIEQVQPQFHGALAKGILAAFQSSNEAAGEVALNKPEGHSKPFTIPAWTARVHCDEYEIGGNFNVALFLGEVPANPYEWITSPNFAGSVPVFANESPEDCANCRSRNNDRIEGFVHLDRAILRLSGQTSLDESIIVPYLKENLRWAVQKPDDTVVDLPSLEVTVIATPLSLPPGATIPVAGEPTIYNDVTLGRPGGCRGD